MRYIVTLTNVSRSDHESIGFRSVDIAVLKEKGFNIPLTLIVNNEAFEDFLAENGLRAKMERVTLEKPDQYQAYQEILGLFAKSKLPKELESELHEAYDSLSIEPGTSANTIISGYDYPHVLFVRSPSYLLATEDDEGILQNVKGHIEAGIALKLVWASIFSPESRLYRQKAQISEKFSMGVIIQKMKRTQATAEVYSRTDFNEFMIRVKSFKGFPDYGDPILGKDIHEVDVNSLLIRNSQVNVQEHQFTRSIENDELVKTPLLDQGSKQKINEKTISECARIAKRGKSFIGKDIKLYLGIYDETINILQVNRLLIEPKKEIVETEQVEVDSTPGGSVVRSESEKMINTSEKFSLPPLLSSDEAKEHAIKDMQHKLFSLNGFIEEAAKQELQETKEAKSEETKDAEEIKKEENLLEEVLKIKELIERMEEHALNNNKESYEQEAKKIKFMLKHLREE